MVCRGSWDVGDWWGEGTGIGKAQVQPQHGALPLSPASSSEIWRRYHQGAVLSQWIGCCTHPSTTILP